MILLENPPAVRVNMAADVQVIDLCSKDEEDVGAQEADDAFLAALDALEAEAMDLLLKKKEERNLEREEEESKENRWGRKGGAAVLTPFHRHDGQWVVCREQLLWASIRNICSKLGAPVRERRTFPMHSTSQAAQETSRSSRASASAIARQKLEKKISCCFRRTSRGWCASVRREHTRRSRKSFNLRRKRWRVKRPSSSACAMRLPSESGK